MLVLPWYTLPCVYLIQSKSSKIEQLFLCSVFETFLSVSTEYYGHHQSYRLELHAAMDISLPLTHRGDIAIISWNLTDYCNHYDMFHQSDAQYHWHRHSCDSCVELSFHQSDLCNLFPNKSQTLSAAQQSVVSKHWPFLGDVCLTWHVHLCDLLHRLVNCSDYLLMWWCCNEVHITIRLC